MGREKSVGVYVISSKTDKQEIMLNYGNQNVENAVLPG